MLSSYRLSPVYMNAVHRMVIGQRHLADFEAYPCSTTNGMPYWPTGTTYLLFFYRTQLCIIEANPSRFRVLLFLSFLHGWPLWLSVICSSNPLFDSTRFFLFLSLFIPRVSGCVFCLASHRPIFSAGLHCSPSPSKLQLLFQAKTQQANQD